ncbi:E3 ubiquitin-protein ligase ARIH2-like [Nycticebus coucang]|uniref:E3 ubiquitin-protein ligase ARIH2-like n=1 Tax=Nycticebus coucang TaxID=9470 RepID=UPI00234DD58D|nr:E3 ubiquitin-protein ligase ARIH2-like [Nycticebus coucang]
MGANLCLEQRPVTLQRKVVSGHSKSPSNPEPRLKFVQGKDEITGDEYDGRARVEMSCGHMVDPGSLKEWCRCLMEKGHFELHCPAEVKGQKCGAQWSYPEVRHCAQLSKSEQQEFEEGLTQNAMGRYYEVKECPGCRSFVKRQDETLLCVWCPICSTVRGQRYEFCWQCLQTWRGPLSSNRCVNKDCSDPRLHILATCATTDITSKILGCPSIRACPTCGLLIKHKEGCKYVRCCRCRVEFCFTCLETAKACKATQPKSWYSQCARGLAPRQSHVPVWNKQTKKRNGWFCEW